MPLTHIGDLSRHYVFQTQHTRIKASIADKSQEMTTGLAADKSKHVAGRLQGWSSIERSLALLKSVDTSAQEAKTLAEGKQLILEKVHNVSSDLHQFLTSAALGTSLSLYQANANHAAQLMESVINDLNTTVAGRNAFAGVATNGPALASADTILSELRLSIPAATSTSDFLTAIDDWFFAAGGGFETSGYLGSTTDLDSIEIAMGETADISQRADSTAIRTTLRNIAVAALAADTTYGFDIDALKTLSLDAANGALSAQGQVTTERAALGFTQSRIDSAISELAAEFTTFSVARNTLIGIDPYEAAVEIENLRVQMETMFTLTSRMSGLSLARFL